jgi:hypothetical protein
MCLFILTSCKTSPSSTTDHSNNEAVQAGTSLPTDGNTSDSDLVSLLTSGNLEVSEDLISQLFQYYRLNTYELSMLPIFKSPEQADWDQFTLYIYANFVRPRNESNYENFDEELTKDKFAKTVRKYFGETDYTDQSSLYLTYANGIYAINNGNAMRHGYYRLLDISKDTNGIYTATFDGLFFSETEFSELYQDATPNIKAIRDAAGITENMQKNEFEKTVLNIFLKEDYNTVLSMTEKVTIQFALSGDDTFPFVYKSCERTSY